MSEMLTSDNLSRSPENRVIFSPEGDKIHNLANLESRMMKLHTLELLMKVAGVVMMGVVTATFCITYLACCRFEEKNPYFMWPNHCVPSQTLCTIIPWCYWLGFAALTLAGAICFLMMSWMIDYLQEVFDEFQIVDGHTDYLYWISLILGIFLFLTGYFPINESRILHIVIAQIAFTAMMIVNYLFHRTVSSILAERPNLVDTGVHNLRNILLWIAFVPALTMPLTCGGIWWVTEGVLATEPSAWENDKMNYVLSAYFVISELILIGVSGFIFAYLMPRSFNPRDLSCDEISAVL